MCIELYGSLKNFSSRQSSLEQFQDIIAACRECFTSWFHAFYPSALLKWFSLCSLLHQIDPVSMGVKKKERDRETETERHRQRERGSEKNRINREREEKGV